MSRPAQLLLVAVVYLLGVAIAAGNGVGIDPIEVGAGLAVMLPVAASVHYANEYADHETDALTTRTPFSGGSGALPATGLDPTLALRAAVVALTVGFAGAVWCLTHGLSPPSLAVLAAASVFGWAYSLPPLALAWRGLGEIDNAALGGLALPLYGFTVAAGRVSLDPILACVPFVALVFANMLETQWPDRHADGAVGKETLAVRWPARRLRTLYVVAVAVSMMSLPLLAGPVLPPLVAWGSFLVLPLVAWGTARFTRRETPFPAVAAMVLLAVVQLVAWSRVAGIV
jgi:1,4-dihydroxy-2-naphthoate octaprenyltransferase